MTLELFTPDQYLRIDIASSFGLDKKLWSERLDWFEDNKADIEALARLTHGHASNALIKAADAPAQFYAGVKAWAKTQRGEPTGHMIHLDATASGAQLLSLLIDCETSGRNCNLVDTGNRENLYGNLYTAVSARLGQSLDVTPKEAKGAVMTSLYGSKRQPKRVFGEGEGLDAFYASMLDELPGAWALNEALIELWQEDALSHDWVLPDNFHVHVKVMAPLQHPILVDGRTLYVTSYANIGSKTGLSLGANVIHSVDGFVVREIARRCSYDQDKIDALRAVLAEIEATGTYSTDAKISRNGQLVLTLWGNYKASGFLSARILEVLDTENLHFVLDDLPAIQRLLDSLPKRPFSVLSIHDAFAVHPNYGNDLRRQYNQVLAEIGASDMLGFMVTKIAGYEVEVAKYHGNLAPKVLDANYALS